MRDGARIFSVYRTSKDVKVWVITEAHRASTCSCCPTNTEEDLTVTPTQKPLADVRAKRVERDRLLRELDLWASVQAQGLSKVKFPSRQVA